MNLPIILAACAGVVCLLCGFLGLIFAEIDSYLTRNMFNVFHKTIFGKVSDFLFYVFIVCAVGLAAVVLVFCGVRLFNH